MGAIRLVIVAGPDADPGYLRLLHDGLEAEWFRVTALGVVPDGLSWDVADTGWPTDWVGRRRAARRLKTYADTADVIDLHGYAALRRGMAAGLWTRPTVYTRFGPPTGPGEQRREAWLMTRVDEVVAARPEAYGTGRTTVVFSGSRAAMGRDGDNRARVREELGLSADDGTAVLVVETVPLSPPLTGAMVSGADGATVLWWGPSKPAGARTVPTLDEGLTAADIVVLPGPLPAGSLLLERAMAAGAAVVAGRVPGVVGRVRCPAEALLVTPDDTEAWRAAIAALVGDADWRRQLGAAAERWTGVTGAAGQARIVQGIYAGLLVRRTGRCPVCPPDLQNGKAFGAF